MVTYLWSFFIFAFLGWCGEVVFAAIVEKRFVNRGFLSGPLCPIYGFGVVLIDLCLRPFGHHPAALLIGSMVVGSALEWVAGFLLEKIFHQKWWDYSNEPHNLNGYICLRFSVLWAFAGTAVVGYVMPFTRRLVQRIPTVPGWVILGILSALLLADFAVTVEAIIGLNRKLKSLETVAALLKEGSDRLGEGLYEGAAAAGEKRQALETEWQQRAEALKEKYQESLWANRRHRRLLKAFPDLKSLRHNKELELFRQNIDVFRRRSSEALRRRNEAAIAAYEQTLPEGAERPFAFGLCYSKLFWIFVAGSFVGFLLETAYVLLTPPHHFELRVSVVFGPFILVYGFGAVLFTLVLYKMYNQKDLLIFLSSMVIGGGFEYACSLIQQLVFGTVSWEYTGSMLSLGGRTNLMYSFFWGVLGLVWVKDLYPVLSNTVQRIPKRIGRPLTAAVSVFMAIDILLSAGAVYRQSERVQGIPAENAVQQFFDTCFPDAYLQVIFPHMQYVGRPEPGKEVLPAPPEK